MLDVRPSPEKLRLLPTLKTETLEDWPALRKCAASLGVAPVLELKLETADTRYWLCTLGFAKPPKTGPRNWAVGYVTVEFKDEDGHWVGDGNSYGPDDTKFLQGNDYLWGLVEKREALEAKQRREHSWETAKEIDEVHKEINQVLTVAGLTPPFQT